MSFGQTNSNVKISLNMLKAKNFPHLALSKLS